MKLPLVLLVLALLPAGCANRFESQRRTANRQLYEGKITRQQFQDRYEQLETAERLDIFRKNPAYAREVDQREAAEARQKQIEARLATMTPEQGRRYLRDLQRLSEQRDREFRENMNAFNQQRATQALEDISNALSWQSIR